MSVTAGAAEDTVTKFAMRRTRPPAVTAPNSAVAMGMAMPQTDPKARSSRTAPSPSPTSSEWFAHQDTGLFHVSATSPPTATDTAPVCTPSMAFRSWL